MILNYKNLRDPPPYPIFLVFYSCFLWVSDDHIDLAYPPLPSRLFPNHILSLQNNSLCQVIWLKPSASNIWKFNSLYKMTTYEGSVSKSVEEWLRKDRFSSDSGSRWYQTAVKHQLVGYSLNRVCCVVLEIALIDINNPW